MGNNVAKSISDHSLGSGPIAPESLLGALLLLGLIALLGMRLGLGRAIALAVLGNIGPWILGAGLLDLGQSLGAPWGILGAWAVLGLGALIPLGRDRGISVPEVRALILGSLLGSGPVLLGLTLGEPRVPLLPLGILVLGAGLQSGAIALERWREGLRQTSQELEAHLSLGATLWQATRTVRRQALRAALAPQLVVAGVPTFILAQVWAGVPPLQSATQLLWLWAGLLWAALGSGYGVCFLMTPRALS
jgi:putative ABC transport system permease protein